MRQIRFTPNDIKILRYDYANYVPTEEIAKKLGRTYGVLRQKIYHLKLQRSNRVTKTLQWAPEHLKAKRVVLGNEAFIKAANQWRKAERRKPVVQRIEDHARDLKIALTISKRTDLDRTAKMKAMRAAGATLQEVADVFGITRERVRQVTTAAPRPSAPRYRREPKRPVMSHEERRARRNKIFDEYKHGATPWDLADKYELSQTRIYQIITGRA
jgi:uncharacterized protein (DUF433 family)